MKERIKKANKITAVAAGQITGGAAIVLVFSIIEVIIALGRSLISLGTASGGAPWFFIAGAITGGLLIWRGASNLQLANRFRKLTQTMADNVSISFINIERRLFWNRKKLLKTLEKQQKSGLWPNSHIDMTNEMFVLDYNPIFVQPTSSGDETVDDQLMQANKMLNELATATRSIEDPQMKVHVEKLTDIGKQIYTHVAEHPDKAGLVRRLSNYFLPTTVGLLHKYLELQKQPVKTDSMKEAMQKIIEVMTTLEAVFHNQLDALYNEKMMDVDVEIEVLQNMSGL